MKQLITLLFALALTTTALFSQRNCGTMDHLEHQIELNPAIQDNIDALEQFTRNYVKTPVRELSGGILTIPVIVHVVYSNSQQNISDNQINSQIAVLNDDFRRLNSDASDTPADFLPVAADTEIEFCLTQVIRVPTSVGSFGTNDSVKFSSSGGSDVVTPSSALNIWVCVIGGNILGYAQFPGGSSSTDGVVIDYRYFGTTGTATAPFDLGRTTTHEVGHWLNLRHIWGDGPCSADDFVNDTPEASGPNYTGSPCSYPGPNSCKPKGNPNNSNDLPDMFQNYMDYSDDVCMNLFTAGQTSRMWAAINGSRSGLISASCDGMPPTGEICDNGIDDDGDGDIDCDDSDCSGFPACAPPGTCDAPTGLSHTRRKGGQEALLEWNTVSGANSYFVEVYNSGGALHASGTVTSNGAIVGGLTKNAFYTWRVRTNCSSGTSDWADGSFNARLANGLANLNTEEAFAYPNPANTDAVNLVWDFATNQEAAIKAISQDIPYQGTVQIQVMDITGKQLSSLQIENGTNQTELDISSLTPGMFIIRISSQDGHTASVKFIKQ